MPISTINTNSISDDAVTVPKVADQVLTHRNLIINGAMQVAQRGTSGSYSANTSRGYVLDRWYGEGYPLNATIAQSTLAYAGITYECASLSSITGTYYFYQPVEDGVKYNKGKNLVLSFVASGSGNIQCQYNAGTVGTVNVGSAVTLTGTPTKYSVAFTLSGSATGDHLYIGFSGSGGSFNVSLVQLELGDTATPFEHRSYGDELARCQRYFFATQLSAAWFIDAYLTASSYCIQAIPFATTMRVSPSTTADMSTNWITSNVTSNVISTYNVNHSSWQIRASGTGRAYAYYNASDGATIKFDAEL